MPKRIFRSKFSLFSCVFYEISFECAIRRKKRNMHTYKRRDEREKKHSMRILDEIAEEIE